jgi:hypothetical protein
MVLNTLVRFYNIVTGLEGTYIAFCTQAAMNCSEDNLFQNVTSNINCTCRQEYNVTYGEEGMSHS